MMNTPIPGSQYGGQASSGLALNASIGYGNYNGGFITLITQNWHGLLMHNNFTYSKALGTGAVVQAIQRIHAQRSLRPAQDVWRAAVQPQVRLQLLSWSMTSRSSKASRASSDVWQAVGRSRPSSPRAAASRSGAIASTDGQSFGGSDAANYFDNEQCVFTSKYTGGVHSHYGVAGGTDPYGNSVGTAVAGPGGQAVNMFKDPVAVWNHGSSPYSGHRHQEPRPRSDHRYALLERGHELTEERQGL